MRKFGLVVLSLLFFVSLLGLAFSTSSNIAFTHPDKMKHWLNQSNLYGAFVENAIEQAERTAGTDNSGGVSLSDAVVKQAAQSTFSANQLQGDVNTFLDSNYAWLEGKTNQPSFSVNLTDAKQSFAERVGEYVKTYLSGLPSCTTEQLAQIDPQTVDPLTLTCRPSNIDPSIEGAAVTEQIAGSTQFLNDPIITAQTINPDGSTGSQPYYQKFSSLPKAYHYAAISPWVAGALTILSGIGVFFLAVRKRKGVKLISIIMGLAGIVLVLTKFVSDQAFHSIERHIFNAATVGQLQKSLTAFFGLVEDQLVKVDLWFGLAYIIIAAIAIIILLSTRQQGIRMSSSLLNGPKTPKVKQPSATTQTKPVTTPKPVAKKPVRRKPPRLVQ